MPEARLIAEISHLSTLHQYNALKLVVMPAFSSCRPVVVLGGRNISSIDINFRLIVPAVQLLNSKNTFVSLRIYDFIKLAQRVIQVFLLLR